MYNRQPSRCIPSLSVSIYSGITVGHGRPLSYYPIPYGGLRVCSTHIMRARQYVGIPVCDGQPYSPVLFHTVGWAYILHLIVRVSSRVSVPVFNDQPNWSIPFLWVSIYVRIPWTMLGSYDIIPFHTSGYANTLHRIARVTQ